MEPQVIHNGEVGLGYSKEEEVKAERKTLFQRKLDTSISIDTFRQFYKSCVIQDFHDFA
jgi:hypothetical protein